MSPNNSFNDIIPPGGNQKRSIRNIPISSKKQNKIDELLKETEDIRVEHHERPVVVHTEASEMPPTRIINTPSSSGRSLRNVWLAIIVVLLLLGLGSLFLFRSADVAITLKTETIPVDILVNAAPVASTATSALPYQVLAVEKVGTMEVNATGAATRVDKKASGTIIIFNNYSSAPQDLIATTRFETPEGLVYRIDKPVRVPGMTTSNGQSVPGSVEAVVYADKPGPAYNLEKSDFTIPGFRGTSKYQGFYARSKTAITGGFSGTMPRISDADLKAANDELKASLAEQALADFQTQKPAGYIFFKDGVRTVFTSDIGPASNGKAVVSGKVTFEGLLFEQTKVEEVIAATRNGEQYRFDNLEALTLSIENQNPVPSFISGPMLSLRLAGNLTTGQSFNEEALRRALADKSKTQLQEILRMYPEITHAEATLRPFWSGSFPDNPEKINITVTKQP